ncbi:MAG TPA: enolase C-terminal domain-like protein [Chthonomonadaceae bacterium]|nr:enolase C-terminal domain-like protein [Chthonomonadaceae bacterium]
MPNAQITRARATPVRVTGKPDSLNSPGIADEETGFLAKFKVGKSWDDFVNQTKWIVELETKDGLCGIGETYRSVGQEEVEPALRALLGQDTLRLNWRALPVESPRAYDAFETAVMDLAGRLLGVPIYQLLGGACRDRVACSGWAGRRTPEDAARKAKEALAQGHQVFKFKCADNDPIRDWAARIQEACGTQIKILLDPNQRWNDVATTLRLMEGVPPEIMYGLEDPVDRQDYAAFREIKQRLGIPLFIHISLPYRHQGQRAEDALRAIREQCADGFNFNGPMFAFVELANLAGLDGKACWHGSEVDCGILEVSALHACAAAPACTIPSDLFGELVRVDDLIEPGIRFELGNALVPQGPGLGVELDREALARHRIGPTLEFSL